MKQISLTRTKCVICGKPIEEDGFYICESKPGWCCEDCFFKTSTIKKEDVGKRVPILSVEPESFDTHIDFDEFGKPSVKVSGMKLRRTK
jgi:hypothetical protein